MDSLVIYKDFYRRGFKYYDKIGADTSGRGYQEKKKKTIPKETESRLLMTHELIIFMRHHQSLRTTN